MNDSLVILICLSIPFLGTTLGAFLVFFMKGTLNVKIEKILIGFAAGVMIAASIWSLLNPAIEASDKYKKFNWLPASIGFLLGIIFLLILDSIIPHLHVNSEKPEGIKTSNFKKTTMLVFAVTLHNIPEGLAVGVVVAGFISGNSMVTMGGALSLAIGIAIQNFPEGSIISMPLKVEGTSKKKAFLLGVLSGVVEPIAGLIALLITGVIDSILPFVLSFAAGAMVYVVVEELIPESQEGEHSNWATLSLAIGFVCMMILDIALG